MTSPVLAFLLPYGVFMLVTILNLMRRRLLDRSGYCSEPDGQPRLRRGELQITTACDLLFAAMVLDVAQMTSPFVNRSAELSGEYLRLTVIIVPVLLLLVHLQSYILTLFMTAKARRSERWSPTVHIWILLLGIIGLFSNAFTVARFFR
jgi:hypothetical protein